jgi:hypothetical protein
MEIIKEKYARLRPQIKEGYLILFHGKSLLSRIVRESDYSAYFNCMNVIEMQLK